MSVVGAIEWFIITTILQLFGKSHQLQYGKTLNYIICKWSISTEIVYFLTQFCPVLANQVQRLTERQSAEETYLKPSLVPLRLELTPFGRSQSVHGKMADHPSAELIVSVTESLTAAGYFFQSLCLIYSQAVK